MKSADVIWFLEVITGVMGILIFIVFLITSNSSHIEKLNFELTNGKELLVSYYREDAHEGEFVKTDGDERVVEYCNNTALSGSTRQCFEYFYSEQVMLDVYSNIEQEGVLEEEIVWDDQKVYYLSTFEGSGIYGGGSVIRWEPKVQAGEYMGSRILSYHNLNLPEGEIRGHAYTQESTPDKNICVIDLNQVDESEYGYLVFRGVASAGSGIDYCDFLGELDVFSLDIS